DSHNYRDYIWLGQIREAAGRPSKEVEAAFGRAIASDGTAPDAWVALVQYLVRTKQTKEAEDAIREAQALIPADQLPLAMAQCQELMGRTDEARTQYQAALKVRPNDPSVLWAAAAFALRVRDSEEAERHLKVIAKLNKPEDKDKAAQLEAIQQSAA